MNANSRRLAASLLLMTDGEETLLAAEVASPLATTFKRSLSAHYPGVVITEAKPKNQEGGRHTVYLRLTPDIRSLLVASQFEDRLQRTSTDPLSGLLAEVASRDDGLSVQIRFRLSSVSSRQRRRARRVACVAAGTLSQWPRLAELYAVRANGSLWERLSVWPMDWFSPAEPLQETLSKLDGHLFGVAIELSVWASQEKQRLAQKRLTSLAAALAPFTAPGAITLQESKRPVRSLMAAAELAALWHLPVTEKLQADMRASGMPNLAPPVEAIHVSGEEEGSLPLGTAAIGRPRKLWLREEDRLHTLLIGKSGTGKSTLMHAQGMTDIALGRGVGLIDPHGDLVEDFLQTIPKNRTSDVLLIDPTDPACPTINPLVCPDPTRRSLVAENNLAALSKVCGFDQNSAPRLIHILRHTLLAIVGTEHGTYLSIRPMLTDKRFRKRVVDRVEDPEVRSFWQDEVGSWSERYEQEAMPAILNKTGQFTANPDVRRLFDDPYGSIDLREVMDQKRILLVNLSQGKLGRPAAQFVGAMLMAGIQNTAMTRADMAREEREEFYLYADEYPSFVNESFSDMLAEARKYGLRLTVAQQLISQVDDSIMDVMFGNLWTMIVFQVAQKDSERVSAEMAGLVAPQELQQLPRHHAVVRASVEGVPSRPFVVRTPPPTKQKNSHAKAETIKRVLARRRSRRGKRHKSTFKPTEKPPAANEDRRTHQRSAVL